MHKTCKLLAALVFSVLFLVSTPAYADPEVDDHYPERGAENVPVYVTIRVEFDEDMDEESVLDGITMRDADGREIKGRVAYDSGSRTATFKPDQELRYNTRYRVRLSSAIENGDGDNLDYYSFYFTTTRDAVVYVDDVEIRDGTISVNHSPVDITIDAPGSSKVLYNKEELDGSREEYYLSNVPLKPGSNSFSFEVVYEYLDEEGEEQEDTFNVTRTVEFVNLPEAGATVTHDLQVSKKVNLFDKQLTIDFPKNFYLGSGLYSAASQVLALRLERVYNVDGSPAVSYLFNIAHVPRRGDDYRYDSFADADPGVRVPPGGKMTLPLDDLQEAALRTVSVLYDPADGVYGNWVNIGGRAGAGKKSITVDFKGFGRYVAVNRLWNFWERNLVNLPFVEYLWAKGIMAPSPAAPPGYFGLVDQDGRENYVSRGEFTVMLGRALNLALPDTLTGPGTFNDILHIQGYSYGYNSDGVLVPLPRADALYIEAAARNGLINGTRTADGRFVFRYHDNLTRQQAAVSVMAAAGLAVNWTNNRAVELQLSRTFKDYRDISPQAGPYVLAAVQKGYLQVNEDWTFRPRAGVTRSQAAALIYRLMESKKLL